MTEHLTLEQLLRIAGRALGASQEVVVRDYGLLESAVARPAATVFGEDAYPRLEVKAAALLHSLITNHALVDGNKRLAWLATAERPDRNRGSTTSLVSGPLMSRAH